MMRISEIISEKYSGFTKGQRLLAAFVLEHCDKAAFMSSFELASVSGVSQSTVMRFATALGFTISIVILAGLREKMEYNEVPESFKGMPMVLLTAGLMAIAFCGFSGLI